LRSLEIVTKGNTSVQILPVDVYGPNADTTSWNVARGIVEAVNNGANVINLSLGGGGDSVVLGLGEIGDRPRHSDFCGGGE
jgi:subtilisin family serine protease